MPEMQIKLAGIWVVVMLIYLLGDVLRLMSGDVAKQMETVKFTQGMWLGVAALMLIPILMVFFTLTLDPSVSRWANIIVAVGFFLFNLVGLPTYPSAYDKFLLIVSMIFNVLTVGYAWNWA
ncbi:MAG: hypothetical protein IT320_19595 [Anaerolineae bacterium]|nr:hypothetical protein [Anaerolineae bacterium]